MESTQTQKFYIPMHPASKVKKVRQLDMGKAGRADKGLLRKSKKKAAKAAAAAGPKP